MTQQETNNFDADAVDDLAFDAPDDSGAWYETDPAVPIELKNFLRKVGDEIEARLCSCSRCPAADFGEVENGIICFCEQLSRISAYYKAKNGIEDRELRSQALNLRSCGAKRRFEREIDQSLEEKNFAD